MKTTGDKVPLVWLGIDPGQSGAAVLRCGPYSRVIRGKRYHDADGLVDGDKLREALDKAFHSLQDQAVSYDGVFVRPGRAVVEDFVLIPDQGLASQAKSARNQGVILGVLLGMMWETSIGKTHAGKGGWRALAGVRKRAEDGGCIKAATIRTVKTALPGIDLQPGSCTTDQDGIADAAGMSLAAEELWRREQAP